MTAEDAGRPTRVLCIDDNRDITAVMRLVIDAEPSMQCVGCLGSANDLVREVQGRDPQPDVVVLDASMPGRDPVEMMKELAVRCPSARVVIYSGHDDAAFVKRVMDAGAWGCVSKNAEAEELLLAVREVAAGRTKWPQP